MSYTRTTEGAVINNDDSGLDAYKARKAAMKNQVKRIIMLEKRVDELETMLIKLVGEKCQ